MHVDSDASLADCSDVVVVRDLLDSAGHIAAARRLHTQNLAVADREDVDEAVEILSALDLRNPFLDDFGQVVLLAQVLEGALSGTAHRATRLPARVTVS